jgi:hypothetical protein
VIGSTPSPADRDALREATDALSSSSFETVRAFVDGLRAGQRTHRSGVRSPEAAFGPVPTEAAFAEAIGWSLATENARRAAVIQASITRDDAARLLGVTPQAVSEMLEREALVGLKQGREWRLPLWQFEAEAENGILPGLRDVISRFPASVVALSRWVERTNVDLDDLTPREALRTGKTEIVLQVIAAL